MVFLVLTGCGYKVRSSVQNLPGGIESLGIPTFSNPHTNTKWNSRLPAPS